MWVEKVDGHDDQSDHDQNDDDDADSLQTTHQSRVTHNQILSGFVGFVDVLFKDGGIDDAVIVLGMKLGIGIFPAI